MCRTRREALQPNPAPAAPERLCFPLHPQQMEMMMRKVEKAVSVHGLGRWGQRGRGKTAVKPWHPQERSAREVNSIT